ncbi:MAG: hypothetical protein EOO39_29425, partial [Cytophagaceae bacterium]
MLDFTTPVLPAYCFPTSTSSGTYINNVTTTNGITNVNNTSGFTAPGHADFTLQTVTQSQGATVNFSVGLHQGNGLGAGVAIWVDWDNNGTFTNAERVYVSPDYIYTSSVSGSFVVPAGAPVGTKRMRVMTDYWAISPSPCGFSTISPPTRGEIEDYSFRVVLPAPALTLNITSSTQCADVNSPLVTITAGAASYNTFSWAPATGVTGNPTTGYTFNAGSTVVYTLTATQTSGDFSVNTVQFTYIANPLPTPIVITTNPVSATTCQNGAAVQLTATGGVVSGVPVVSENFNSGFPSTWTRANTGTGAVANGNWTVRPDGFVPTGPSWGSGNFHSNDATAFVFSDSDAQGFGSTTNVELVSPVFSLFGLETASLSFWHYYRQWPGSTATVEISTNGGTSYAQLPGQIYTTTNQGSRTNFKHVVVDLASYVG